MKEIWKKRINKQDDDDDDCYGKKKKFFFSFPFTTTIFFIYIKIIKTFQFRSFKKKKKWLAMMTDCVYGMIDLENDDYCK